MKNIIRNLENGNATKTSALFASLIISVLISSSASAQGQLTKMIKAKESLENIKAAIAKGAPIDGNGDKNEFGYFTPLMAAASNNEFEIAKILLMNGASVNKQNESQHGDMCTALFFASQSTGDSRNLIKLLLDSGAEVEGSPLCHTTPLIQSTRYGGFNKVKVLLQNGANPNKMSRLGELPITAGLYDPREGILTVLEELIAAGADVNARDGKGNSAFTLAIQRGAGGLSIAQLLLAKGAHPEITNSLGETPYQLAKKSPQLLKHLEANKEKWGRIPTGVVQFRPLLKPRASYRESTSLYLVGRNKRIDVFKNFDIINSDGKIIWSAESLVNHCLSPQPVFADLDDDGSIDFYVPLGECKFQTTFSLFVTYKEGTEAFMIHYDSSANTLAGTQENITEFMKKVFETVTKGDFSEDEYSDLYSTYNSLKLNKLGKKAMAR